MPVPGSSGRREVVAGRPCTGGGTTAAAARRRPRAGARAGTGSDPGVPGQLEDVRVDEVRIAASRSSPSSGDDARAAAVDDRTGRRGRRGDRHRDRPPLEAGHQRLVERRGNRPGTGASSRGGRSRAPARTSSSTYSGTPPLRAASARRVGGQVSASASISASRPRTQGAELDRLRAPGLGVARGADHERAPVAGHGARAGRGRGVEPVDVSPRQHSLRAGDHVAVHRSATCSSSRCPSAAPGA